MRRFKLGLIRVCWGAACVALVLTTGCGTSGETSGVSAPAPAPAPKRVEKPKPVSKPTARSTVDVSSDIPFPRDPVLEFTASCKTGSYQGCERLAELRKMIQNASDVHDKQMKGWLKRLRKLAKALKPDESKPTIRLTEVETKPKQWSNPDSPISVNVEVRLKMERGLKRLGDGAEEKLKAALEELQTYQKETSDAWGNLISFFPRGLVLPSKIVTERSEIDLSVRGIELRELVSVPAYLVKGLLKRDVKPWEAIIAHVRTTPKHKYTLVQEHRLPIPAALTVSESAAGIVITESRAQKQTKVMTSTVQPNEICDSLRAELRFNRQGDVVRKSLSVTAKKGE